MRNCSLVVLRPQEAAEVVAHQGVVTANDIVKILGARLFDARSLGPMKSGRPADMYVDDEGLLNDAPPNRLLPGGVFIAGTIFICARDGEGESLPLTDEEVEQVVEHVSQWKMLPAGTKKPVPQIKITPLKF